MSKIKNIDKLITKYKNKIKREEKDLEILSDMAYCREQPYSSEREKLFNMFIKDLRKLKGENNVD